MKKHKVAILIPAHRPEHHLRACLESALAQNCETVEAVVYVFLDGPDAATKHIAEAFADEGKIVLYDWSDSQIDDEFSLRYTLWTEKRQPSRSNRGWTRATRRGPCHTRNRLATLALTDPTIEWVRWLDADDEISDDCTARQLKMLDGREAIAYCDRMAIIMQSARRKAMGKHCREFLFVFDDELLTTDPQKRGNCIRGQLLPPNGMLIPARFIKENPSWQWNPTFDRGYNDMVFSADAVIRYKLPHFHTRFVGDFHRGYWSSSQITRRPDREDMRSLYLKSYPEVAELMEGVKWNWTFLQDRRLPQVATILRLENPKDFGRAYCLAAQSLGANQNFWLPWIWTETELKDEVLAYAGIYPNLKIRRRGRATMDELEAAIRKEIGDSMEIQTYTPPSRNKEKP